MTTKAEENEKNDAVAETAADGENGIPLTVAFGNKLDYDFVVRMLDNGQMQDALINAAVIASSYMVYTPRDDADE